LKPLILILKQDQICLGASRIETIDREVPKMICFMCLGHFQPDRSTLQHMLHEWARSIKSLRQILAAEDAIRHFEQGVKRLQEALRSPGEICPWTVAQDTSIPDELINTVSTETVLGVWGPGGRDGVDIAENAENGCDLCVRISVAVAHLPKFNRSIVADQPPEDLTLQTPSPDNIRSVRLESFLELRPGILIPDKIKFLVSSVSGDVTEWIEFKVVLQNES
jgi:hypothetical protein